jgi:hypothetical protein
MTLMHNKFEERPEVLLITYEDIIKCPYPFLLNKIDTKLSPYYESFLDLEKFKGMDMDNLLRLCIQRSDIDIFKFLAKEEFDTAGALKDLKDRYFEIYKDSPLLKIGNSLGMMLSQKFTEKIYIYSEVYDIRIHLDVQENFPDMERVNYVSGNFEAVLDKLEGITTFIVNDIDYIVDIINKEKAEYANIMLASYGYNYFYNDDTNAMDLRCDVEKIIGDRVCKFATFIPVDLSEKHFSQLRE